MKLSIIEPHYHAAGSILVCDEDHNDIAEFYHSDYATVETSYDTALALAKQFVESINGVAQAAPDATRMRRAILGYLDVHDACGGSESVSAERFADARHALREAVAEVPEAAQSEPKPVVWRWRHSSSRKWEYGEERPEGPSIHLFEVEAFARTSPVTSTQEKSPETGDYEGTEDDLLASSVFSTHRQCENCKDPITDALHASGFCGMCREMGCADTLRSALKPFAAVAESDIGQDETDADIFQPMRSGYNREPLITVGDMRRAALALSSTVSNTPEGK